MTQKVGSHQSGPCHTHQASWAGKREGAALRGTAAPFDSPETPQPTSLAGTCTMLLMTMGRIFRGKRRMLNKAKDTKAFWASRTLFLSTVT